MTVNTQSHIHWIKRQYPTYETAKPSFLANKMSNLKGLIILKFLQLNIS